MTRPDLQPTGERLLPDHYEGQLVHAEHLARYRLAAQLAPGRRVLDVACGEGYGSALLRAAGAEAVTAVDVDPDVVAHARERHGVDAREGDVRALPFEDDAFDLVVSFETIEHVEEPERALDELARLRAPDGLMMISTPVAGQYMVDNEFHVREFGHDEFLDLLGRRFTAVRPLYQHNWLTSAILDEEDMARDDGETALEAGLTKVRGIAPGGELYLVALCGDDLDVGLEPVGVLAGTDESHELAHRLDDAIRTQERYRDAYETSERAVEELRGHLARVVGSRSWRMTRPLRALGRLRRGR